MSLIMKKIIFTLIINCLIVANVSAVDTLFITLREATRTALELQQRRLEAEEEKFRVGKSTNFMVLQAQRDFIASQLSHARAKVAYNEALVNLYVMEGTLLARRRIE